MEHYRVLAYTRGVRELVTFESSHAVVDSMIIDGIKNRMSKGQGLILPNNQRKRNLVS